MSAHRTNKIHRGANLLSTGIVLTFASLGHAETITDQTNQAGVPGKIDAAIIRKVHCDFPGENGRIGYLYEYTEKGGHLAAELRNGKPVVIGTGPSYGSVVGKYCNKPERSKDFASNSTEVNQVMEPQSLVEAIASGLRGERGRQLTATVASQFGIDGDKAELGRQILVATVGDAFSETRDYNIELAPGFTFCRARIEPLNMTAGGGRPPELRVGVQEGNAPTTVRVYASAWTPRNRLGDGRSIVHAVVTILQVDKKLQNKYVANGTCYNYKGGSVEFLNVKGDFTTTSF